MLLDEKEIRRNLARGEALRFKLFDTIPSTNTYVKDLADKGESEGLVALADTQTGGRGRMGRSFASPNGSGIYMSLLLRPSEPACTGVLITACAAVAVSEAIENITGIKVGIKWVNDLYYGGKKVCGILAEGAISKTGRDFEYAVLGIGLNLTDCFTGTELEHIAGGLYTSLPKSELNALRHRLIAAIIDRFYDYYRSGMPKATLLEKYRMRLFIIGKKVDVISYSGEKEATVIGLNGDFTLLVRYADGSEQALNSGEVRLKLQ
ncbi:MAG: biotin--[Clostridia bacterium]|nr:biotin--[acetyl-CoA-carboxylase] ligase [Clostridia bacterium]